MRACGRLSLIAIASTLLVSSAWAYRPFDGTDAAVAEQGVFELEAGVGHTRIGDVDSAALPVMVFNYGLAHDTEIVFEGQVNREIGSHVDGPRTSFADTDISVKHVFVRGSLQDGTGPSVAAECAFLLPEVHGSRNTGGECAAIVSNKWDSGALHLNLGLGRTREHDTARSIGLIAEGSDKRSVRPVAELLAERDTGSGGWLDSVLVGAIYQRSDDLAFDVAFRHARTSDSTLNEVRVGFTWCLSTAK